LPAGKSTLMCAFNKSIQTELESRAPEGVTTLTLHSLGYRAVRRAFPKVGQPDKDKLEGYIVAERGSEPESYDVRASLHKAISLAKGYLAHTPEEIDPMLDKHGIDTEGDTRESFIRSMINIMEATKRDTNRVDFDDMIWFPVVHNLRLDKYDRVMIDEAQDLNMAQMVVC
jgi:superfamily I DNA/RNA helicase